jgi:hypothetical protein
MSATARVARTAPARRRPTPAAPAARRRPILTEVPAAPAVVAGRGVFALAVLGMLVAGMGVLLVLNTSLAQGAFELGALTKTQGALAVQEQHLLQQVALEESPDALQVRASALGMVPVAAPVFLRLSDGAVLGTPTAAVGVVRPRATTLAPVTGASTTASQVPVGTTTTTTPTPPPTATPPTTTGGAVRTATANPMTATPLTAKGAPAKAAAPKRGTDAAVADPAPQSDAAVADTTPTVHR